MPDLKDMKWKYVRNTAFPYVSNTTPISQEPNFVPSSYNVLTSIRQLAERRPGLIQFETTPTKDWKDGSGVSLSNPTVQKIFSWQKYDGTVYVMCNVTGTGHSVVYKYQVGLDTSFVTLYDDATSSNQYEFVVSNDILFFSNLTPNASWKWGGGAVNTVAAWGIGTAAMIRAPQPLGRPTTSLGTTGITATVGYKYVYCYHNSGTLYGHTSSASNPSLSTGVFTNKTVTLTLNQTPDAQVDRVRVFRTTDGGGGVYFEIAGGPFAHTPGTGTMTVTDSTSDVNLSTQRAPVGADLSATSTPTPSGQNDPPPNSVIGAWYQNRIWTFANSTVYYSGWEEIDIGLEEQCFPPTNYFRFDSAINGMSVVDSGLIVFTQTRMYLISGDSLDTFRRDLFLSGMGANSRKCITKAGRSTAWLDSSNVIRITDGYSQQELSYDIRPDINAVASVTAEMKYYDDGVNHWIILTDGTGGNTFVYDMDTQQWMVPWSISARSCWAGPVGAQGGPNTYKLFFGLSSAQVGQLSLTAYTDYVGPVTGASSATPIQITSYNNHGLATGDAVTITGVGGNTAANGTWNVTVTANTTFTLNSSVWTSGAYTSGGVVAKYYTARGTSNLIDIVPESMPGKVADFHYLATETNSLNPSAISYLLDEDPTGASYTDITANVLTPTPYRTQGTNLLEKWYYSKNLASRRVSIRIEWGALSTNFKLYSLAVGYFDFPYGF